MDWTNGLNDEQKVAVLTTDGPLLILAGAGSGKTSVLVSRTGHILSQKKAEPEEVLVLTFTNKAAKELNERVGAKLKLKKRKIKTGTFHSFGLDFLKKNYKLAGLPKKFGIVDSSDSRFIIKDLLRNKRHNSKDDYDPETLLQVVLALRSNQPVSPSIGEEYLEMGEWVYPDYMKRMESLGVVDFDGLILKPIEILKDNPDIKRKYHEQFKYLMVDEFQDTNAMQMNLVKELVNEACNIGVVGDDDQSIYGWRGAEIKNILNFPSLYKDCKVVRLETNYRSTPEILTLANSIIDHNKDRHKKTLKPSPFAKAGPKPEVYIYEDENRECEEVVNLIRTYSKKYCLNDIAVLYRSNAQGGVLEGLLRQSRIPYDLTGGPALIDRKEVRDALAYIKASLFPDDLSLRRVINTPHRGVGDLSIQKIIAYQDNEDISFVKALRKIEDIDLKPKAIKGVHDFLESLDKVKSTLLKESEQSYENKLTEVFKEVGLKDYIFGSYKESKTAQKKWLLIEILGRILDGFFRNTDLSSKALVIKDFIDALSLRDSELESSQEKKVQLLTFHASKGLEFPVVILMGVDEGLIPHERLGHDISEERRLFYVGATRAKKELIFTRSRERKRYGKKRRTAPSRFLAALPKDLYSIYENGFKPVNDSQREDLLAELYKKLNENIAGKN